MLALPFYLLLLPASGGAAFYRQLKRPGFGPQAETDPESVPLFPPQENSETTRCGLGSPHLGQMIFGPLSEAP
jgi:hypothetical protein